MVSTKIELAKQFTFQCDNRFRFISEIQPRNRWIDGLYNVQSLTDLCKIFIIHLFQNNSSWSPMRCFINVKNARKYIIRKLRYRSYIWDAVWFRKSLSLKKMSSQNVWNAHVPSVPISLYFSYLDSFSDTYNKRPNPCFEFRASSWNHLAKKKKSKKNTIG